MSFATNSIVKKELPRLYFDSEAASRLASTALKSTWLEALAVEMKVKFHLIKSAIWMVSKVVDIFLVSSSETTSRLDS